MKSDEHAKGPSLSCSSIRTSTFSSTLMSASTHAARHIIIVGGGIIGCTTAYYLTRHPCFHNSTITLLEASHHGAAQGASGKAGGLVARWAYPKEIVDVSFEEHVKLAKEHGGQDRWGWRFVDVGSWEGRGEVLEQEEDPGNLARKKSLEKTRGLTVDSGTRTQKGLPDDLIWVKEHLTESYSPMARSGATAQVHPYLFTTSMLELAKEKGLQVKIGCAATKLVYSSTNQITSVEYKDSTGSGSITATDVIICAGAWSPNLIPGLPIEGTRAHSVVIRTPPTKPIAPYVLFTEITCIGQGVNTPEIYARPDGTVYACGPGDESPLPDNVDDVVVDSTACQVLLRNVSSISDQLRDGEVEKRQACFLPVSSVGGGPIIGQRSPGLYIATGHTCWGISNAPGTAKAISELVLDGKIRCANLKSLQPSKFF
ncbi:DAO domain-containing protein [Mycena indigotica]|uniref:DAO domain-containing protein n=1 Tax=Mycena indigotica TaxID=2126181 RepID=A0A8H6S7M7_9AGAR|nr:DAO domain-containing protein [Mycena indigotica]KAF7292810.1 DAO domain-containing protein [Mycena indigotica]